MLPILAFDLPEWTENDFAPLRKAEKKMKEIGSGSGESSPRFRRACELLRKLASVREIDAIHRAISDTLHVRAYTFLLYSDEQFARCVGVGAGCLSRMRAVREPMTKLSLLQLVRAYFNHFDSISNEEELSAWSDFIQEQLAPQARRGGQTDLAVYAEHRGELFSPFAPYRLVKAARKQQIDFDGLIRRYHLGTFSGGVFLSRCQNIYYLETIRNIPVGENDPVLQEVVKPSVCNSNYIPGKLLGLEVLEILIDRSPQGEVSQAWQNAILSIAGDPRVPRSNPSYQKWWSLLGDERVSKVRGWLSRFDLKLFLDVLEQSARDGKIDDMERMFKPRKAFMEGLLESGVVSESRLFLGDYAEHYLKRQYKREELPAYTRVHSRQTSMIYLNLAGSVHMIEGSHSFRLKLLDKLPSNQKVRNYDIRTIDDSYLRSQLMFDYHREYGASEEVLELTHDVHFNWQRKAIAYLKYKGVKAEPAKLIHPDQYRAFKQKVGVI
ncbi:EH signature domain-containing protein [Microbulbifer pacificus]|uniref:EH signature domain-containing protein n=1 Tax=Microbulbifer pacificus TaxID=407164 RepID=A0AAU0N1H7_9GAMM|nr:EH signature domain-containing protein [Microbulbifer pacificus]WOX05952.1 EH signature domain-containing protein [Microbulbifer pacificus]